MMEPRCDLVLGGGGVRGLAHIGALQALGDHGYEVARVAGASAGAVVGAFTVGGVPAARIRHHFGQLDLRAFALSDIFARMAAKRGIGGLVNRLPGDRVDPLAWITGILDECGITTFGDLRVAGTSSATRPEDRYRLVVRCLDVVQRRVVRLPWDYPRYGLDPDEQPVAEAVRASMSIPFVYAPVPIGDPAEGRTGLLVDGGLTSGFPVSVLDRNDRHPPRWPTFGVRLLSRPREHDAVPVGEVATARMILEALLEASDLLEPLTPCDEFRTIRVDVSDVGALEFDAGRGDEVIVDGRRAMERFLAEWDGEAYLRACRDRE